MTGRDFARTGAQIFRYRQSSLTAGGRSPGIDTPACMQAGANERASRIPGHGVAGCGSRQRRGPRGGAAKGIPRYTRTRPSTSPCTRPDTVRIGSIARTDGVALQAASIRTSNANIALLRCDMRSSGMLRQGVQLVRRRGLCQAGEASVRVTDKADRHKFGPRR